MLDASGVYDQPAAVGAGGIPAGRRDLDGVLVQHLGRLEPACPASRQGRAARRPRTLGRGGAGLAGGAPRPRVTGPSARRTAGRAEIAGDPLPEAARVTSQANELAQQPPGFTGTAQRRRRALEPRGGRGRHLSGGRGGVDAVLRLPATARPLVPSELALDVSPVSEGAAGIARALSVDRLPRGAVAAERRPRLRRARLPSRRR